MRRTAIKTSIRTFGASQFTVWANSNDIFEFQFMADTLTPVDLSGLNVGIYLMTGATRKDAACRRPSTLLNAPDTAGLTVVAAKDGRIDYQPLASDFLNSDTTLWMEFWALQFPDNTVPVASTSGGSLPDETYYYIVKALISGEETLGQEKSVVLAGGSGSGKIDLTWDAVPDATNYRVYYKKGEAGTYAYKTEAGTSFSHQNETGWTVAVPSQTDNTKYMLAQYRIAVAYN